MWQRVRTLRPPRCSVTCVKNGSSGWTWTDTTGATVQFDGSGRLVSKLDRYGDGVEVTYVDRTTKISAVQRVLAGSSNVTMLTFIYTGNHITSISDTTGRTWLYGYNSAGRLVSVTAPISSGSPLSLTQYGYYAEGSVEQGLLQTVTDADGNVTQFSYYVNRRGFQVTDAEGQHAKHLPRFLPQPHGLHRRERRDHLLHL